ncbi:MAG: redoxin domain-containing protein [Pseudomonadales bacterium]|nr:redoxin domain-containing protein [Pseudomonadales bacterium]
MQLSKLESQFAELGISVYTMTYDDVSDTSKFHSKENLSFPILQDVNAKHVKAFGILNEDYEPGHRAYGIPHAGMFLVDEHGVIFNKFSEKGYMKRPPWDAVLDSAKQMASQSHPLKI